MGMYCLFKEHYFKKKVPPSLRKKKKKKAQQGHTQAFGKQVSDTSARSCTGIAVSPALPFLPPVNLCQSPPPTAGGQRPPDSPVSVPSRPLGLHTWKAANGLQWLP